MSVGVAVSTFRRPDILAQALEAWDRHGGGVPLVVNRDSEDAPQGSWAMKNAGIAALMDAGVDHLFLVDDDCWPRSDGWWEPYVADPLPHLMWCWGKARRLTNDGHYTTWKWPRGVMLYAHRTVVDRVGGMRSNVGRWGVAHVEWSRRIHNAGLTPAPFVDLAVSSRLWHAEDMGRPGESSAELARRRQQLSTIPKAERPPGHERAALLQRYERSAEFVEYR